tara:strand:+ start:1542 stop:2198 length:657 start_codon:yes stop_codon:yes gene_type:complete
MKIQFITDSKNIQYQAHRKAVILRPARVEKILFNPDVTEQNEPADDISAEPQIIQDLCNALWPLDYVTENKKVSFDINDALVKVDGRVLNPDSDVTGENAEVQAFFNAIYSHDDCCIAECYRLRKECEAGDVPVTETEEYTEEAIEIVDGKAVKTIVTKTREVPVCDEYPLFDENDNPILDEEGNPVVYSVQRVVKLSQEKKDHLCLLQDKIAAMNGG